MIILTFVCLLFFIQFSHELNNGLGRTPQMGKIDNLIGNVRFIFIEGWNSWNRFQCSINEKIVRQSVDAIVASGLPAVGYQYGMFFSYFST
jgi:alpha-galactosidase